MYISAKTRPKTKRPETMTLQEVYDNLKKIETEVDKEVSDNDIAGASTKLLRLQQFGGLCSECIYEAKRLLGQRQNKEWDAASKLGYRGHERKHYLEGVMEEEIATLEFAEKLNGNLSKTCEGIRTIISQLKQEMALNKPMSQK